MSLDDHNAFHSILNKYIPESPSSGRRTKLIQELELSGYTEDQKREYYVRALEKSYEEFAGNDDSLQYFKDFMKQVDNKLRTKIDVSDNEVRLEDIKEIFKD
jgi:hypothetical protein